MPIPLADSELLAAYERRSGSRVGWEYAVKGGVSPRAMDVIADEGDIKTNDKDMSVTYPFASSQSRDRVGDFLEVSGIDTANHKRNPVAFLDHAKWFKWSLGLDQNPDTREYTVEIEPNRGLAIATTCIVPLREEHHQVYEMYRRGVLRCGSIGYRTIEEQPIGPDQEEGLPKGKHLIRTELLETSLVFLPCSQDAVRRMLDEPWGTKSLADAFRAQLEPVRPRKKAWANGAPLLTIEIRQKSMAAATKTKGVKTVESPSPAMSTRDAGKGGAQVGPPDTPEEVKDDAVTPGEEAVSHNVQRMTDVHHVLSALREIIDADPQLIDHPDVKQFLLEDCRPKIDELIGSVQTKFAETHPDYEPLGDEKDVEVDVQDDEEDEDKPADTEAEVKDEDEEEDKDVDVEIEDDEEEDEDEDAPAKSWHANPPRRKGLKGRNKSGKATGTKALNSSQKMCMKDVQTHLEAASQHADVPEPWKSAHAFHATKVADMLDAGGKSEVANDEDAPPDVGEEKLLQLFGGYHEWQQKSIAELKSLVRA